ncbi:right-handed parallel beta-helix repeat-containing protein [Spirosoma sp. RP8]|uniref:Right-handed parallel beta-helix repeat-containing protein n=1 Tax=Spirosoma liriopis TaxID=2937440 RepID=A0ABT0HPT7_9BACT|nr:right-handed parallel beta-helix repeat-containing protein [Spirosoma liriopis]MCK8493580.1 right-handed parallel beta-helix repeat-containing protein [Spirosoma liriopis]
MKHIYLIILVCCLFVLTSVAQPSTSCNCAVTINAGGTYQNTKLKLQPGQTLCIQAGHYDAIRLVGFVGSATNPIRIVNCGGQVGLGSETSNAPGLEMQDCKYVLLSGSGDSSIPYGIKIDKSKAGVSAVSVGGLSSNYEVERIEVAKAGYAGFFMKTDPGCDTTANYPNFTINDVKIHDNYIHHISGPGMFLGSGYTMAAGRTITCNGVNKTVYPAQTYGMQVYNNRIERTSSAAMWVNNAPDANVHDNTTLYNNLGSVPAGWQVGGSAGSGCDYTITKAGAYNNWLLEVAPGKKVCVQSGLYDNITLANFAGTPTQPIRFVNAGGQVLVQSNAATNTLQLKNSRYIALSGAGDAAYPYGFKVNNQNTGGYMGISVSDLSSDVEIDHVEVAKAGFAGIMAKTDPGCDSTTWRSNFTMYNVKIHDNYIHDVGGEGLYIGNSFFGDGMAVSCNGVTKQVYPHLIYGLDIYNNRIERTGAEGLQYGCAPDAKVHHNWLKDTGISPFANYQNNGLQVGGGAGGECYNNTILNASGVGLIIVGHWGNNRLYNNVISQPGSDGIFCDERTGSLPDTYVQLINNTISGCGRDGIRLYNQINVNTIANNAITNYGASGAASNGYVGKAVVFQQGATATMVNNYTVAANSAAGFVDAANANFALLSTSPLIDAGANAAQWGVTIAQQDQTRPQGSGYDIGAFEFVPSGARQAASASADYPALEAQVYPLPVQDQLTIQVPEGIYLQQIEVYSLQGKRIQQIALSGTPTTHTLNSHDWPAGLYLYLVLTNKGHLQGRLVKK